LEKRFGQEYVKKKITIIGLDDKGERRWKLILIKWVIQKS
jgi:hypothetical protein